MTQYEIYQRDPISGHMNIIARLSCRSDDEAASQGSRHAGIIETRVYEGQRIVAQFRAYGAA